jgi:hypothetical protein
LFEAGEDAFGAEPGVGELFALVGGEFGLALAGLFEVDEGAVGVAVFVEVVEAVAEEVVGAAGGGSGGR